MFKAHLKGNVSTFNYRKYRNKLQSIIRLSKRRYLHDKCSEYRQDSKKLWRLINELIKKTGGRKNMIESLKIKNLMKYDPDSITTEFCEFFSTVGERFASDIKPPQNNIDHYLNKMQKSKSTLFLC